MQNPEAIFHGAPRDASAAFTILGDRFSLAFARELTVNLLCGVCTAFEGGEASVH
jgi:hypothetical protein